MALREQRGSSELSKRNQAENTMGFSSWMKKGLLGYQPIFFPNGLISGTGFQFFGNLRNMRAATQPLGSPPPVVDDSAGIKENASFNFNQGRLGNLYIPPGFGDRSNLDTEFYYCVDDAELEHFARYNLALLEMYEYFGKSALAVASEQGLSLDSMIEIGANTCLFPLIFSKEGVADCHGADIVDYSEVVNLLSEIQGNSLSFHHMTDDSDQTWKALPKADLVWSYAVLLHQSNPLAHLTRLASLAKKAIFIMTLCDPEDWKSDQEMAIRYLSANSYYNADFPNCFDVTIVSPALIKYSLQRLGFSKIIEISHPDFDLLDDTSRADLKYWLNKHCFFIAFRDDVKGDVALNDYSVSAERSPYRGNNVLVHSGFHNNVVLSNQRYFIVPHGAPFAGDGTDIHLQSFSSLTNAMKALDELPTEVDPQPLLIRALKRSNLIRYKKRNYLSPHGLNVDFKDEQQLLRLSSLDSVEKWDAILASMGEEGVNKLEGALVDFIDDTCIIRANNNQYKALNLTKNSEPGSRQPDMMSSSYSEIVRKVTVGSMLSSIENNCGQEVQLYRTNDGRQLRMSRFGQLNIICEGTGKELSKHDSLDEAWRQILRPRSDAIGNA